MNISIKVNGKEEEGDEERDKRNSNKNLDELKNTLLARQGGQETLGRGTSKQVGTRNVKGGHSKPQHFTLDEDSDEDDQMASGEQKNSPDKEKTSKSASMKKRLTL